MTMMMIAQRCLHTAAAVADKQGHRQLSSFLARTRTFSSKPAIHNTNGWSDTDERLASTIVSADHTKHDRSPSETRRLIQARVQQRDSWSVEGQPGLWDIAKALWNNAHEMMFHNIPSQEILDQIFPVQTLDWNKIANPPKNNIQITWLGHASLLVQMNGVNILTDPMFSERCSPFQWLGPKRYRPPPTSIKDLCSHVRIDVVLISHNHYDHLDLTSIQDIVNFTSSDVSFVVPLGLKAWFQAHVESSCTRIHELDWHEQVEWNKEQELGQSQLQITAVPMRHWSNRGIDRDETLWCGYSVTTGTTNNNDGGLMPLKFLFPGDTAWFDGLHDIGKRYGPFDVSAIPIGAYEPREFMKSTHINVEEAIQMKDAVQANMAVPIHWGTIDLPFCHEPVMEPREKLLEYMNGRSDKSSFVPWLIGETKQTNK